jgi:hypothetical protein
LPDILDVLRIFAEYEGFQVIFDGRSDCQRAFPMGGAADTV